AVNELGLDNSDGYEDDKKLQRLLVLKWEAFEHRAGDNYKPLSKQERWALRFLMEHPEVNAWRATLDGSRQRKLNHPNNVISKWRSATQPRERKKAQPSMSQALKEKNKVIDELEARNRELAEERPKLTLDDIVNALVEMWQDQPVGALKVSAREFNKHLNERMTTVWNQRRQDGIPTAPGLEPKKKRGKRDPFKQAEDAINAALGNLMKGD